MNITTILQRAAKLVTLERVILVGLIIFLFLLNRCNNREYKGQLADSQNKIDSLTLANQKWDSTHNKDGQTILQQTAIVTSNQKAIRELTDSIFNQKKRDERRIKNVIAFYSAKLNTGVDSVTIAYNDTAAMKRFSDSVEAKCADVIKFYRDSSVQVPKPVKDSSSDFVFDGTVMRDSFRINKISFPDSLNIRFNEVKGGLFKRDVTGKVRLWTKRSIEVQVMHSNQYVSTSKMNSVFYQPKKSFRWLEKAVLVAAGIYVGLKLH